MSDAAHAEPGVAWRDASVAKKVNNERVVLLGWATAILMQFAHPKVAAAIADHSTAFAGTTQWIRRSLATIDSMLDLTFGEEEDVDRAIAAINAIHRRVRGTTRDAAAGEPGGVPYSAQDPTLLLWVHVTLEYALSRTYDLFVGPLTMAEKDRGCAESVTTMVRLGIPAQMLPTTLAEVYRLLGETLANGDLAIGEQGRALARDLLRPPLPALLQPFLAPARLVAIGLLPPPIRAAYGFGWSARHDFALRLFAWLVRHLLPLMPAPVRYWRHACSRRRIVPLIRMPGLRRRVA